MTVVQVNMIKDDGQVLHFNNPKVQASLAANTFAITGHAETKRKFTGNGSEFFYVHEIIHPVHHLPIPEIM